MLCWRRKTPSSWIKKTLMLALLLKSQKTWWTLKQQKQALTTQSYSRRVHALKLKVWKTSSTKTFQAIGTSKGLMSQVSLNFCPRVTTQSSLYNPMELSKPVRSYVLLVNHSRQTKSPENFNNSKQKPIFSMKRLKWRCKSLTQTTITTWSATSATRTFNSRLKRMWSQFTSSRWVSRLEIPISLKLKSRSLKTSRLKKCLALPVSRLREFSQALLASAITNLKPD